ncbi:MAG: GAF domain-containing protein [Actinomycetota bacterium]
MHMDAGTLTVGGGHEALLAARWREVTRSVVAAMLTGEPAEAFLRVVADGAAELIGGDVATIGVPWIPGRSLRLRIAVGYRGEDLEGSVFPVEESLSGLVLQTREGLRLQDATASRNAYQPICELGDMGPTLIVPLVSRDEPFGTLLVARRHGATEFTEAELAVLQGFSDYAALAIEFGEAGDEVARLAVVEEQERIARQLHDTVLQHLFAIGLELQTMARRCGGGAAERIHEVAGELDALIDRIRSTVLDVPTPSTAT